MTIQASLWSVLGAGGSQHGRNLQTPLLRDCMSTSAKGLAVADYRSNVSKIH